MVHAVATYQRAKHFETGATVYKPKLRFAGNDRLTKSRIIHQEGGREQGATFPTKEEAIASAERYIAANRADALRRATARTRERCSDAAQRGLQAEWAMWGGEGDVFGQD